MKDQVERHFVMILDRSGSMSGSSFRALQEGAKKVAQRIYEAQEYSKFTTLFFNNKVEKLEHHSFEDFSIKVMQTTATSNTDLKAVFDALFKYCERNAPRDLTVLMLTDGEDTCNQKSAVNQSLTDLELYLRKKEIDSRMFTIGLTENHDALLLS